MIPLHILLERPVNPGSGQSCYVQFGDSLALRYNYGRARNPVRVIPDLTPLYKGAVPAKGKLPRTQRLCFQWVTFWLEHRRQPTLIYMLLSRNGVCIRRYDFHVSWEIRVFSLSAPSLPYPASKSHLRNS